MNNNGVYSITNKLNGKKYVGSSASKGGFKERWKTHKTALRRNKHANKHLQRSWNKNGEKSFKFEILEKCKKELCIQKEQFYIDNLNPEYNICRVAGNTLGRKHSKTTREKISKNRTYGIPWNKNKKMSTVSRRRMSKAQKQSTKSKEHRDNLAKSRRKAVFGVHVETDEKIKLEYINQSSIFYASGIKQSIVKNKPYKQYQWYFKSSS